WPDPAHTRYPVSCAGRVLVRRQDRRISLPLYLVPWDLPPLSFRPINEGGMESTPSPGHWRPDAHRHCRFALRVVGIFQTVGAHLTCRPWPNPSPPPSSSTYSPPSPWGAECWSSPGETRCTPPWLSS